ncbi:TAP-like protein-domain-containing protein [Staphylotrichum tortipilum]|uniref:TAP-like protein-domain-containing protein n=1 Tax=Staphylotrichum tortipilum TaxID=2831512 RepID=A0AAN6RPG4_9PEZI|nr:TAP-like protein-domain-containing protein [Staphylotrichum longicolle]
MNPWENIPPSPDLTFHPCYTFINRRFVCARLTVPLTYAPASSPSSPLAPNKDEESQKVHIAILLLPALNATAPTAPPKQPLLVNPGGPGGSGTLMALLSAPALQKILGEDQPVMGFDPRGVPFTTPVADCWVPPGECDTESKSKATQGDKRQATLQPILNGVVPGCDGPPAKGLLHRLSFETSLSASGTLSDGPAAIRSLFAAQLGANALCHARFTRPGGTGSSLGWMGTRLVARDMLSIVDAWGEWMARQHGGEYDGDGRLVYWGFSYGTYLGAVFARIFPGRVGRLVLDGVVDAEFYEGPVWKESLVDADKVLGRFFWFCAVVARERCAFYRKGDQPGDVKGRYEGLMERLRERPGVFTHPEFFFPVVVREAWVKLVVFTVLYQPVQGFPVLARLLDTMYEERYGELAALFGDAELVCAVTGNPVVMGMLNDAQRAIMCGDKTLPVNMTVPELTSAYEAMAATSQFADIWMGLMLKCNGWDIPAGDAAPSEPWSSFPGDGADGQIETAHPILFLSNTYDPVTPLRAAVKMALKFKGAGFLEQMSQGHCTISAASPCTAKIVRDYVTSGTLPPPPQGVDSEFRGRWTRCVATEIPWGGGAAAEGAAEKTVEEREVEDAWGELQKAVRKVRQWGVGGEGGADGEALMAVPRSEGMRGGGKRG